MAPRKRARREPKATPTLKQENWHPFLQLDSEILTPSNRQLVNGHLPYPDVLLTWETKQNDPVLFGAQLIGDARLKHGIPVAVSDLVSHSEWAAARCKQNEVQRNGLQCVLPVCTSPDIVERFVRSIYSGFIELKDDVEQMLVLANSIQVGDGALEVMCKVDTRRLWCCRLLVLLQAKSVESLYRLSV